MSGDESLADKWILAKLNNAAKEANKALAERSFMTATNVIHQYWLYDLCDVYIVSADSGIFYMTTYHSQLQ